MKEEKQIDWRQAAREARREGKADKLHLLLFLFFFFLLSRDFGLMRRKTNKLIVCSQSAAAAEPERKLFVWVFTDD